MSYTELVLFREGLAEHGPEYGNSWGGAAFVWNKLFDLYCKQHEYDNWMMGPSADKLWKLAGNRELPMFERAVHSFTFDNAVVKQENFRRFAADLRSFWEKHGLGYEGICHLLTWADYIEASDAEAVALHATSVNSHPWIQYDEEKDKMVPYSMTAGDKHWEIYEELESHDSK